MPVLGPRAQRLRVRGDEAEKWHASSTTLECSTTNLATKCDGLVNKTHFEAPYVNDEGVQGDLKTELAHLDDL